jgi:Flp pilus assembly pilin Flp
MWHCPPGARPPSNTIAAGIAVAIIVAVQTTGTNLQGTFNSVANALQ